MKKIGNYLLNQWHYAPETIKGTPILHAHTLEKVYEVSSEGVPIQKALDYARTVGGKNLRSLTFHQRAKILKELAKYLMEKKETLYALAPIMGANKRDAWVDIEGGIGTVFTFASKAKKDLPNETYAVDGNIETLSKEGQFSGLHIYTSRQGVAVHINAFNFPCWGLLEKFAPTFLAGVPSIIKPASATCFLSEKLVELMVEAKLMPEGSLQLISGSLNNLLDNLNGQDTVTFTGSAETGLKLKSNPHLLKKNVRFNMEADSLNSCVLGPDVHDIHHTLFETFIKEVKREVISKAGQKCTAIRRVFVPVDKLPLVQEHLIHAFKKVTLGEELGPLVNLQQVEDVKKVISLMKNEAELVYGGEINSHLTGAFLAPHLFVCNRPLEHPIIHTLEAFGPVTTLMPYKNNAELIQLCQMGEGSLVASVVSDDQEWVSDIVEGISAFHGRILVLNSDSRKESTGHGSPLAHLVHGGPGRAGGGEELGGIRSVFHYMQRVAIQSSPQILTRLTNQWAKGSKQIEKVKHPFRCTFEELEIGQTYWTARRTITEADVVNFAGISGDYFYAHMDEIAARESLFKRRVAHGYFILSAAAGLFVDGKVGPVLANYGLENLRFIQPVYPGDTIVVRLTVKKKTDKEPKADQTPQGVVEFDVEVFNQSLETTASYSILTLVKKEKSC